MRKRRVAAGAISRAGLLAAAGTVLSGCLYANAGVTTFSVETVAMTEPAPAQRSFDLRPSGAEIQYARETLRSVFRRRDGERSQSFLAGYPDGYALCIRSAGKYALIVFQRRIYESQISQAADDTVILHRPNETEACRPVDDWTKA
ncbi:hypothetical protein Sa4125_26080 [Aureimonas sp. SA4125]|uniref:hypothetical protein n=1 Tax=Aureimonas sp. SA4125 TaxID=2826993 RepID=UPI001CC45FED|nr:hypothetical protein [Aureimonas sp. SA4125]BDA85066.1 hypothetical protein Sa4125_26080 [Aureimonas sp. SA4125]